MKKGKVMIIGAVGSGKSTLTKKLLNDDKPAVKTQALNYAGWIIDTPGEYSENPMYYRSLMATSLEAKVLLVIQDATRENSIFPPNFSQGFPLKPIGVITKIDHPLANVERARILLQQSIPNAPVILTSSVTSDGIKDLIKNIQKHL
ncbi:EutP/PduV family microcompartment system protein [Bacillus songklensis]|uniref:EutP/PduV family microcompartment system protein n=1 Tax=Bacillus songklensis TaxID=1069116 RepID=A0ABV8B9L5_9BACI